MQPRAFTCAVILAAILLRGAADVFLLDDLFMECGKIGGGGSRPEANAKRRDECALIYLSFFFTRRSEL